MRTRLLSVSFVSAGAERGQRCCFWCCAELQPLLSNENWGWASRADSCPLPLLLSFFTDSIITSFLHIFFLLHKQSFSSLVAYFFSHFLFWNPHTPLRHILNSANGKLSQRSFRCSVCCDCSHQLLYWICILVRLLHSLCWMYLNMCVIWFLKLVGESWTVHQTVLKVRQTLTTC